MSKVYTTGHVSAFCKVAPRTVSKWFDSGRLVGYRIPGSNDRRIPRENLIRFLRDHSMPMPRELAGGGVLAVLLPGSPFAKLLLAADAEVESDPVGVGFAAARLPNFLLLEGINNTTRAASALLATVNPAAKRVVLLGEDEVPMDVPADWVGVLHAFRKPCDPKEVADYVRGLLAGGD